MAAYWPSTLPIRMIGTTVKRPADPGSRLRNAALRCGREAVGASRRRFKRPDTTRRAQSRSAAQAIKSMTELANWLSLVEM